jgi:hypothetical protein
MRWEFGWEGCLDSTKPSIPIPVLIGQAVQLSAQRNRREKRTNDTSAFDGYHLHKRSKLQTNITISPSRLRLVFLALRRRAR